MRPRGSDFVGVLRAEPAPLSERLHAAVVAIVAIVAIVARMG